MRWLPILLSVGCVHSLPPTLVPDEALIYRTDDGWTSEIRHFPGEGPPVLMVHGMGANHFNFDYREEVSLAYHLQQAGWDVWVPELRGDPGSIPPSRLASRSFDFDDHAAKDLPAIVDAVLAATGEEELYWVGHSMGGMLLYTAISNYPEQIAAGVAIASPATFDHQLKLHKAVAHAGWIMGGNGRIPARALAAMSYPLGRNNPLFARLADRKNLDFPVVNGMARTTLVDLPRPMARQAMTWLLDGQLVTSDGEYWLRDAATADSPLLVLGATHDKVAPERDVAAACEIFSECRYVRLSVADGFAADYGHVDSVIGVSAPSEIYPLVLEFLEEHRLGAQADLEEIPGPQ